MQRRLAPEMAAMIGVAALVLTGCGGSTEVEPAAAGDDSIEQQALQDADTEGCLPAGWSKRSSGGRGVGAEPARGAR